MSELVERLRRIAKRDTCNSPGIISEAADKIERLRKDAERSVHGQPVQSFGVDSVSGRPGGNGKERVAATRAKIDAAMIKTPNR